MKKKNVLVTGIGQTNYILQLYGVLSQNLFSFTFNVLNLKPFGDKNMEVQAESIFKNVYSLKPDVKKIPVVLKAFIPVLLNSYFWKDLIIHFVEKGNFFSNAGLRLFLRHINAFYYAKFIDEKTNTQVIHLHFPKHIFSLFTKYLKKDYELIWTYWGSDIYRLNTWRDHEIQNSELRNVDVITATTLEMEFAILSRFGFQHRGKIKRARFIHDYSFYKCAEALMSDRSWERQFKESLRIPPHKIIIMMGHNGHYENNHHLFIESIKGLSFSVLNKFHLIFPFSYGNNKKGYLEELQNSVKETPCSFEFIEKFLDWEDLAKLKIVSDVYVHCPTTDGLSAFLTEFFFTGNLAIVGGWLPYNTFKNFELYYLSFYELKELKYILTNLEQYLFDSSAKRVQNKNIIDQNFNIDRITQEWVEVYKELEVSNESG